MKFKVGSIEVNFFEPSGWAYDTDEGMAGSVGLFGMVSGGLGGGRLTVKQTRGGLRNTGHRYRMPFTQVQVGIGTPWPIPVSVGGGIEDYPSGSFGPVFRMPGAPDASGEDGPPTGFLGTFNMVAVEGVAVAGGLTLNALLMGANTILGMEVPNSFKYITFFWGVPIASVVGASATGIRGTFLDVNRRYD